MKQNYEVRVAYIVYDYYNVVAESEDEAKELAEQIASSDSLNDFQLQETICTIESVKEVSKEQEEYGDGEIFNGILRIRFVYGGEHYSFPITPEWAESDPDLEDTWNIRLQPTTNDNLVFVLMGHYAEDGESLATSAPLMIRVEDAAEGESYIDDIDIY